GSGQQTIGGWATNFTPGPADESNQTVLAYHVTVVSNPGIFALSGAPTISPDGTLRFTPANNINATTTATVQVRVQDNGGGSTDTTTTVQVTQFLVGVGVINGNLVVNGTGVADNITVTENATQLLVNVNSNPTQMFTKSGIGRVIVRGFAGTDTIRLIP